ncbi:VIT domain-containing protein [Actinomadura alba]|uniref:VWA domain-containing protein n=1 Tax=Actinomadura alba TaxID=406431 RepID=A0ABR7LTJ7_9ACTN|nr:VIT domain-containing protein [Actinomadura alba]MBC6468003.1 VWA domain-containing protein [Actinomadura alba]
MTVHIAPLFPDRPSAGDPPATTTDEGMGALTTDKGNLPLDAVDIRAAITGLGAGIEMVQGFHNPFDVPLEATYIFPLPDRAAVTAMRMEAADRVIEGTLKERGQAREDYDAAIAAGQRAAIAEEDRPDVFTMRVGNILPGERVTVTLKLSQPLPYEDDAATFRFPLVVAPRYIPGAPLDEPPAGDGVVRDTEAVPDASRISPPVLLPGFPNPIRLELSVEIDPAGLPLTEIRSSYGGPATDMPTTGTPTTGTPATGMLAAEDGEGGRTVVRLRPGQRLDRDFILRLGFARQEAGSLTLVPDETGDEGTFTFTVMPSGEHRPRPRDVVLALDRSGSMQGWKIVAARRAAARIIDTLTGEDRFAVLSFDHVVQRPAGLPDTLVTASDRNRFRAVEHLAGLSARGGTEMLGPLAEAAGLLGDSGRDRVLVLITDGQVGNEDQILAHLAPALGGTRVHAVGIDRAVNAGFLGRLASIGQGRFELVESEERLDEAMERIHHRIGAPLVTGLTLEADGLEVVPGTVAPGRLGALFPGVPLVISGRWRGGLTGATADARTDATAGTGTVAMAVRGVTADGAQWRRSAPGTVVTDRAAVSIWARAHLRELEDRYVTSGSERLEKRIVDTSLRFGVLCRFTAFVAVDSRVVAAGQDPHPVVQPVEMPDGWGRSQQAPAMPMAAGALPATFGSAPDAAFAVDYMASEVGIQGMPAPGGSPPAPLGRPMGRPGGGSGYRGGRSPRGRTGGTLSDRSGISASAPDPLSFARQQARQEVELLTGSATAPDDLRRQMLSDLRTRLDALIILLEDSGVAEEAFAPLVELRSELRSAEETFHTLGTAELWERTVRVLTEFADGGPPARRAFWKRQG